MSRHAATTALVLLALLVPSVATATASPGASTTRTAGAAATSEGIVHQGGLVVARIGRGFGGGSRSRYRTRNPYRRSSRPYRRPYRPRIGHVFGNVLKALGVAYLVHLMFGWGGGGGSPFGLLIVAALVAWLVSRRRRRRTWDVRY